MYDVYATTGSIEFCLCSFKTYQEAAEFCDSIGGVYVDDNTFVWELYIK
jgi:hypothetical protein